MKKRSTLRYSRYFGDFTIFFDVAECTVEYSRVQYYMAVSQHWTCAVGGVKTRESGGELLPRVKLQFGSALDQLLNFTDW